MKKLMCLGLMFLLMGCSSPKVETTIIEVDGIKPITYEELTTHLNDDVTFMLYIGRPDCGDCQEFYPMLNEYVINNDVGLYYLNIKEFRDSARSEDATDDEIAFYDNIQKELQFDWVPTIHIIQNNQIIETYQYLDLNYYEIEDPEKQTTKKEEFISEFKDFMNSYFTVK